MLVLHTKFLVHWTGKDFHRPPTSHLDDNMRALYAERLLDDLEHGLYMNKPRQEDERIYSVEREHLECAISRTCFTETKLNMAQTHALRYGSLGIGVDRAYVIERYGNPVFYVYNGDYSNIMTCALKVHRYVKDHPPTSREFSTLISYLKKMGDYNSDDLRYYDELEWRIVHLPRLEDNGVVVVQDPEKYVYRIRLAKHDVKVIVFPDRKTKDMCLNNKQIQDRIDNPICVTVEDCSQF